MTRDFDIACVQEKEKVMPMPLPTFQPLPTSRTGHGHPTSPMAESSEDMIRDAPAD